MERKKLEEAILEKAEDRRLACAACWKIADDFAISKKEMAKILIEMKIKIWQCQLGCLK